MPSFNKVIMMGHITRDPQMKYLPSQTALTEFGIAMNRKFKGGNGELREEVCFVDCAAFGKTGEIINQYCHKGNAIFIDGRLKFDSWDDKNGGKRSKLSVIVDNVQFLGGKPDGEKQQTSPQRSTSRPPRKQEAQTEQPFGDEPQFGESDIPF